MLLQTNSYIVPKDKRAEHARLVRRFRQTLHRLGCEHFEVYEQVGANWGSGETTGRYVHIMRFRDRKHQLAVQAAERNDPAAQALINEFCELINFPYQQQQGLFAVGFYQSVLPVTTPRPQQSPPTAPAGDATAGDASPEPSDGGAEDVSAEAAAAEAAGGAAADDVPPAEGFDETEDVAPAPDDHVELDGDDGSSGEPSTRHNA